jgi:NAD(P)-dependent dehydrogenase (short-subunit alcohol dehydrogenase family)
VIVSLFDMSGQVAVVTGAGRGIGEGIATAFAEAGAAVVVAARRADEVERVAADIRRAGGRAIAVPTDVTDDEAVGALADAAVAEFGSLTCWVNNAGGSAVRRPLRQLDRAQWNDAIALNLTSVWVCCVAAAERMESGSIINISSRAGFVGVPGSGHYAASKAAVNSLTQTLSLELAPKIRVNGIAPGSVPTEIMMTALGLDDQSVQRLADNIPLQRLGTPTDIAAAALYLASEAGSWVTGQTLIISGGR